MSRIQKGIYLSTVNPFPGGKRERLKSILQKRSNGHIVTTLEKYTADDEK